MSTQSIISKIALPYAEALLEIARDANLIKHTNQDISVIATALSESTDLKQFLSNPLIDIEAKKNVLNKLLLNQVNDFVLKFLLVLVDRRRISLLSTIIEKYLELAYSLESTIVAQISTAVALTELQQDTLVDKIKQLTNSQHVKLVINIDSSLIGGFIIQIGSKVIDTSLSGKLKQIALYLKTN
uniref:ATP synthase CF1 delta subunit n=1 Tax=Schimmelmannia schousboei TaxID=173468 RepID=A0A1C9C8L2_9FLOR|nr:ATP synthase CF1 delta subunit [Schimmelmannia schousboei]AOM64727.1 ATP synthase CF1 delta subunit [Schimmelmannia schousboei]